MKRFAVVDIGSNSVRLLFVADGKILYKRLNTTRLGEGIAQTPLLKREAIERTAEAVAAFYVQAKEEGAEEVFAFATAAVRTAHNRADFLRRVDELCGLQIQVLSGEEEAELGLVGALGAKDGGVIDIGGASTEVVVRSEGELRYKKSVDIGVVRLKDSYGRREDELKRACEIACRAFEGAPATKFYAIGGTATTLAAQCLHLREYSSEAVTGAKLSLADLQALVEKLSRLSVEEISALPCMPKGRADVLLGGGLLLVALMQELGLGEVTVSDRDNLEGYAVKRGLL